MRPVTYEADHADHRDRLTTIFRLILAIPWLIVYLIYAIGSLFVTVIARFALVITARYPDGLRSYNTGFLRYHARVTSWIGLQTDEWPPFGFGEDPTYPVRLAIMPPVRQSRARYFFRAILAIPAVFMSMLFGFVQGGAALISWFSIVFRGYQPRASHDAFTYAFTNSASTYPISAYRPIFPARWLLIDDYPPIGAEGPRIGDVPPAAISTWRSTSSFAPPAHA